MALSLVFILVGWGLLERLVRAAPPLWHRARARGAARRGAAPRGGLLAEPAVLLKLAGPAVAAGGLLPVAWGAFKVGALSYGGGFVIIPLVQHDAGHTYHWMTTAPFPSAVRPRLATPGPV